MYITIYNGNNNPVGSSCFSAHQAVSKFSEYYIIIYGHAVVSIANAKLQLVYRRTLINRLFSTAWYECITITVTDSKFSNRVLT